MSWGDWFEDIWEAIVAKIVAISDFGSSKVFFGEKNEPTVFPSAYVCPTSAEAIPMTMRETNWQPNFDIGIVVQNADTKAGMVSAWKLAGKVIEALEADRTLDGLLNNLECTIVIPYWRGLGRGMEVHWIGVSVKCERKL